MSGHSSSSSVDSYERCPRQWSYRYGPHREIAQRPGRSDTLHGLARRRGRILHESICTALRAAERELAGRTTPLAGWHLDRYWATARRTLGEAWEVEQMPSDPAEAVRCVELLRTTLAAVEVPAPGTIHGIERRYEHVTPGGVAVVFIPDYTRWVRPGVLRVTDWKSRAEPVEVGRHQQLLRYAGWLAQIEPDLLDVEIELFSMRDARGHVESADPVMVGRALERFDAIVRRATADPDPQPKTGPQCSGCAFKSICPAVGGRDAGQAA